MGAGSARCRTHSIAAYGGNTVLAATKFAEWASDDFNITVLVDFENDSVQTRSPWHARSGRNAGRPARHLEPARRPVAVGRARRSIRGVNERLVWKVREALDADRFERVRIVVSGGFDAEKIARFEAGRRARRCLRRRLVAHSRRKRLHGGHRDDRWSRLLEGGAPLPSEPAPRARRVASPITESARCRGAPARLGGGRVGTARSWHRCARSSSIRSPWVAVALTPPGVGTVARARARYALALETTPGHADSGSVERTTCAPVSAKRANTPSPPDLQSTDPGTTTAEVQSSRVDLLGEDRGRVVSEQVGDRPSHAVLLPCPAVITASNAGAARSAPGSAGRAVHLRGRRRPPDAADSARSTDWRP